MIRPSPFVKSFHRGKDSLGREYCVSDGKRVPCSPEEAPKPQQRPGVAKRIGGAIRGTVDRVVNRGPKSEPGGPVHPKGVDRWVRENGLDKWSESLSKKDVATLQLYMGIGHEAINEKLRRRNTDQYRKDDDFATYQEMNPELPGSVGEAVKILDAAIAKSILKADVTVYRGVSAPLARKLKLGSILKDNGFTSTSLDMIHADDFADRDATRDEYRGMLIEMRIPKGTHAAYLSQPALTDVNGVPKNERELIIARGSRYRVISRNAKDRTVVMELVQ